MNTNLRMLKSIQRLNDSINEQKEQQIQDVQKMFDNVVQIQNELKTEQSTIKEKQQQYEFNQAEVEKKQNNIENEHLKIVGNIDSLNQKIKNATNRTDRKIDDLNNKIDRIKLKVPKDGKDGYTPIKGIDYFDGKDGKDGERGLPGVPGTSGKDGVGITNAEVNSNGDLIITFTNGKKINVGHVKGQNGSGYNGRDGANGISVTNAKVQDGHLYITLSDGREIDAGLIQGGTGAETDPIFVASPAHEITDNDISNWNNKSDFSGDYNDLSNKPINYKTTYYDVQLNPNGTINSYSSEIDYQTIKDNLQNNTTKDILLITWVSTTFLIAAVEETSNDIKFIGDIEFDGIQRRMVFTLNSSNVLATTLITTNEIVSNKSQNVLNDISNIDKYPSVKAVVDYIKPVVIWESNDPTTYLKGLQSDLTATPSWQLTGLNMAPFRRIKVYSCAGQGTGISATNSTTTGMVLEILLDSRNAISSIGGHYVGSVISQKPNNDNRLATLTCAVSSDKTSFAVLRQTNLYGTGVTNNNDVNANVFLIEGYYY